MPRPKTRTRIETAVLKMNLGIAAFLGAAFVLHTLMDPLNEGTLVRSPAQVLRQGSERAPAAAVTDPDQILDRADMGYDIVVLDCQQRIPVATGASMVRLQGGPCQLREGPASSEVENLSNGTTATVFHRREGFVTDLLQLSPGLNRIRVRHFGPPSESQQVAQHLFEERVFEISYNPN